MRALGAEAISDGELLAVALGMSMSSAYGLLAETGGFAGLVKMNTLEFQDIPKVGKSTASKLVAMVELSRRISQMKMQWVGSPLRQPCDVANFVRMTIGHKDQEHFVVIGLSARQHPIFHSVIAMGSLAQVDVHPREIFRPCIRNGVHAIVIAHNHPSGDPEPSEADIELTNRMCDVGVLVGIPVLDHVIVTPYDSVSLASLGLVPGYNG